MSKLLIAVLCALPVSASTITYDLGPLSVQSQNCIYACPPVVFSLPQFDTSQGSLEAVDFTFTDVIEAYQGINDMAAPLGEYTATFTISDTSALLGLDDSSETTQSGWTYYSPRNISAGGSWQVYNLATSGSAPDVTPFEGTGSLQIAITPLVSATSDNPFVQAGILEMWHHISLDVTYIDPPAAVPEPRIMPVVLLIMLFLLVLTRRSANSPGLPRSTHSQRSS